jgi:peroxiredoxin Q/BCP
MAKSKTASAGGYPAVGSPAPDFAAPASGGKTVRLSGLAGRIVVLYFYPKDNTSGCTKEACGFRDAWEKLRAAGVEVVGVSPDSVKSHEGFAGKYGLPFTLVSDDDKSICRAYGVWQEKSMYGRKYMGVARTTFVIDKKGKIAHVFEKVKAAGHEEEVLEWVRENLQGGRRSEK